MDEKERKSCIFTIKTLMNLAYNIHGVMDVVDVDNCKKIIEMLDSGYLAGRWIPDNTDYYRTKFICSVCGESEEVPTTGFGYGTMWDYCPMCGAKMERRQDGH